MCVRACVCGSTHVCILQLAHTHNPLLTGDTQEQVAEQDEDSDDVPGICVKSHALHVIMCELFFKDLVENFDEASKSEM